MSLTASSGLDGFESGQDNQTSPQLLSDYFSNVAKSLFDIRHTWYLIPNQWEEHGQSTTDGTFLI